MDNTHINWILGVVCVLSLTKVTYYFNCYISNIQPPAMSIEKSLPDATPPLPPQSSEQVLIALVTCTLILQIQPVQSSFVLTLNTGKICHPQVASSYRTKEKKILVKITCVMESQFKLAWFDVTILILSNQQFNISIEFLQNILNSISVIYNKHWTSVIKSQTGAKRHFPMDGYDNNFPCYAYK